MRTLAVLAILSPIIAALAIHAGRPAARDANACSFVIPDFDDLVVQAQAIVLADALEVGDDVKRAQVVPTIAPSMTPSVEPSSTPEAATQLAQAIASPTPTYSAADFGIDLRGVGATLDILQVYHGDIVSPLRMSEKDRARLEAYIRRLQANPLSVAPCSPEIGVWRYEHGARYVALIETDDYSGTHATHLLRVEGDMIVLDDSWFFVNIATYKRYFATLAADSTNISEGYTGITEDIPLDMILQAIDGIRTGDSDVMIPPETGSAGLRDGGGR